MAMLSLSSLFPRRAQARPAKKNLPFGRVRYPVWYARAIFGIAHRRDFYRQLRISSLAQTPLAETIKDLRQQATDTRQKLYWFVLNEIDAKMSDGAPFSAALQDWCPSSEILLLSSGRGGARSLADAITRVLRMQKGLAEMRGTLVSVMLEPTFIVLGTYGLVVWMATNFVHALLAVTRGLPDSDFTGLAHQLIVVGELGSGWRVLIPPGILLAAAGLVFFSFSRWTGALRKYADSIPPWSLYRSVQGAAWMQSFSLLAESKVDYQKIMKDTAALGTPWLRERVLAARHLMIRPGMPVGSALWSTGYNFPSRDIALNLKSFGARPGFAEALSEVADEWFEAIVTTVKQVSVLMGILTMVLSTIAILWTFQASNDLQSQVTSILRSQYGG